MHTNKELVMLKNKYSEYGQKARTGIFESGENPNKLYYFYMQKPSCRFFQFWKPLQDEFIKYFKQYKWMDAQNY